eukprot:scaffold37723_cov189-Skeletonema_marinoi.AAC.14
MTVDEKRLVWRELVTDASGLASHFWVEMRQREGVRWVPGVKALALVTSSVLSTMCYVVTFSVARRVARQKVARHLNISI